MKWIAAVLMILNVLIFLGISDRQVEYVADQQELRPDVNVDSMLLLKEVYPEDAGGISLTQTVVANDSIAPPTISSGEDLPETVLSADRITALEINDEGEAEVLDGAGSDTDTDAKPDPEIAALIPAESGDRPDSLLCYRVGPFKNKSVWAQANSWAQVENLAIEQIRSESRELRAVRVYVGPFESIAAAQGDVDILKQKELDYFVYLRDDNQARISLGYFTQEELSIKFVDYLKTQNIEAKSQPEYRTLGPFDWMDIEVDSARRETVVGKDWGDDEIETVEREC